MCAFSYNFSVSADGPNFTGEVAKSSVLRGKRLLLHIEVSTNFYEICNLNCV